MTEVTALPRVAPWQRLRDPLSLIFAGWLYAAALKYFVLPSKVVLTGTEGIASSLSYYFESPALFLVLYLIFQAVLFVFALRFIGRDFALRTLAVVGMVVIALVLLPDIKLADPEPQNERILLVLFGGLLAGVAKAIAFERRGSTGDEDVIGAYFAIKYLKPVGFIAILSAVVSTAFGLILVYIKTQDIASPLNTLMYTCIYIFASAETLNTLYKKFQLSMLTVISDIPEAIGAAVMRTSPHRTFTLQDSVGGRSGASFKMLRVVLTHEELPDLLDAIKEADPDCFFYFHDIEGVSNKYYITPIGSPATRPYIVAQEPLNES